MKNLYFKLTDALSATKDLPLLLIRLTLAYGFYGPAMMKIKNIEEIVEWFESMEMVAPKLNAYLVTYTEFFGFILLTIGLGTRFIAVPLMIAMLVAIKTVHWGNGFSAGDNGFEIPLYYLVMLLLLFFTGPGRISLDHWIAKKVRK